MSPPAASPPFGGISSFPMCPCLAHADLQRQQAHSTLISESGRWRRTMANEKPEVFKDVSDKIREKERSGDVGGPREVPLGQGPGERSGLGGGPGGGNDPAGPNG